LLQLGAPCFFAHLTAQIPVGLRQAALEKVQIGAPTTEVIGIRCQLREQPRAPTIIAQQRSECWISLQYLFGVGQMVCARLLEQIDRLFGMATAGLQTGQSQQGAGGEITAIQGALIIGRCKANLTQRLLCPREPIPVLALARALATQLAMDAGKFGPVGAGEGGVGSSRRRGDGNRSQDRWLSI
jgi:hypothetical protein